jgi:predicted Zn-dependent protease
MGQVRGGFRGINSHERYHKAVKSIFNTLLNQNSAQKHKLSIAILILLGLTSPSLTLGQAAKPNNPAGAKSTPLLGVGEDGDLSLGAERRMGDAIAKQIYRDPDYLDDPLLNEYIDGIWQSLLKAARAKGELSAEMDERFAWRVMLARDRTVNAFALPGGYFGADWLGVY